MYARVNAHNKESAHLEDCANASLPEVDVFEEYVAVTTAEEEANRDKANANHDDSIVVTFGNADKHPGGFTFSINKSVYTVNIGNLDVGHITNGFICNPIEKRLFDFCFQTYTLINQWIKSGLLPVTLNAITNLKVGFKTGKGGAPAHISDRIEMLAEDYEATGTFLSTLGLTGTSAGSQAL